MTLSWTRAKANSFGAIAASPRDLLLLGRCDVGCGLEQAVTSVKWSPQEKLFCAKTFRLQLRYPARL